MKAEVEEEKNRMEALANEMKAEYERLKQWARCPMIGSLPTFCACIKSQFHAIQSVNLNLTETWKTQQMLCKMLKKKKMFYSKVLPIYRKHWRYLSVKKKKEKIVFARADPASFAAKWQLSRFIFVVTRFVHASVSTPWNFLLFLLGFGNWEAKNRWRF